MTANLADFVRRSAAVHPQHPALISGDRRSTWLEVDRAVDAVGSGLGTLGLVRGDRVGLVMGNSPEFVSTYFGALRAGLVVVPVNPAYTAPELRHALGEARVSAVVCDEAALAAVRSSDGERSPTIVATVRQPPAGVRTFADVAMAGRAAGPVDDQTDPEDLAVILFTSGTGGLPRGAMLSHRALRASVEQVAAVTPPLLRHDDVVLVLLPLFHVYALGGTLGAWAHEGATAVLVDRFDPEQALALVAEHHVTNIPGAPGIWRAWAQRPDLGSALSGVRVMVSGAAPLPAEVLTAVTDAVGAPLFEAYGLTEAAPGVSSTAVGGTPKPGSVGKPFPGVTVRLRNEDGTDAVDGDPGEIVIRGDNLFSGYWPDGTGGPDQDGWYATGDVAYADADGDLVLVDRRKELILVNGFNVYPREVEEVLQAVPGVREAAVVGVPDEQTGEAVCAYLVLDDRSLTADEVLAEAARSLARFKRPTTAVVVDRLPHSATGKIAKGRLRGD